MHWKKLIVRIVSYRIVSYRIVSYRIVSYRIVLYCYCIVHNFCRAPLKNTSVKWVSWINYYFYLLFNSGDFSCQSRAVSVVIKNVTIYLFIYILLLFQLYIFDISCDECVLKNTPFIFHHGFVWGYTRNLFYRKLQ